MKLLWLVWLFLLVAVLLSNAQVIDETNHTASSTTEILVGGSSESLKKDNDGNSTNAISTVITAGLLEHPTTDGVSSSSQNLIHTTTATEEPVSRIVTTSDRANQEKITNATHVTPKETQNVVDKNTSVAGGNNSKSWIDLLGKASDLFGSLSNSRGNQSILSVILDVVTDLFDSSVNKKDTRKLWSLNTRNISITPSVLASALNSILPKSFSEAATAFMNKLESGGKVSDDLYSAIAKTVAFFYADIGVSGSAIIRATFGSYIGELSTHLEHTIAQLKQMPQWMELTPLEKLVGMVRYFDYREYGHFLLTKLDEMMPEEIKESLKDITSKGNSTRTEAGLKLLVDTLIGRSGAEADDVKKALENLNIYTSLAESLDESLQLILKENETRISWEDTKHNKDFNRFVYLLENVNYEKLFYSVLGMIAENLKDNQKMKTILYPVFARLPVGEQRKVFVNRSLDILVESLGEAYNITESNITGGEFYLTFLNKVNTDVLLRRIVVAFAENEADNSTSFSNKTSELLKALRTDDESASSMINAFLKETLSSVRFNISDDVLSIGGQSISQELRRQLKDADTNNTLKLIAKEDGINGRNLTDAEMLAYLVMMVDYQLVGQKLVDQLYYALNVVSNDTIKRLEENKSVSDILQGLFTRVPYLGGQKEIVDFFLPLISEIDSQFQLLSKNSSRRESWKMNNNQTSLSKLADLFANLEYTRLQNILMSRIIEKAAPNILRSLVSANSKQISQLLPKEVAVIISNLTAILEAGENMTEKITDMLAKVTSQSQLIRTIINLSPVKSFFEGTMNSIRSQFKSLENTWNQQNISYTEKFLKFIVQADLNKLSGSISEVFRASYQSIFSANLTERCRADTAFLLNGITTSQPWSFQIIDAWGKIPHGVLQGDLNWFGDMPECESVKTKSEVNGTTAQLKGAWSMLTIDVTKTFLKQLNPLPGPMTLKYGVCLPDSCTYQDQMNMFSPFMNLTGANITHIKRKADYPNNNGSYKSDAVFIGASAFFGSIALLVLVCTTIDGCLRADPAKDDENLPKHLDFLKGSYVNGGYEKGMEMDEKSPANGVNGLLPHKNSLKVHEKEASSPGTGMRLVKSFSLYENLAQLFDSTVKPNQLRGLDGIRFLSMTYVILGHTYVFPFQFQVLANQMGMADVGVKGDWTFFSVAGGFYAVDSFFVLSGLLVGYLFLKMMDKMKGKITCSAMTLYYAHRYLRLLPLYVGLILIVAGYSRYVGYGPFHYWNQDASEEECRKNWWINLLYINNVYQEKHQCVGHTWYLANDMQFYIIAPLVLIPLYKKPLVGFLCVGALWITHVGVTAWLWARENGKNFFMLPNAFTEIYIKPYCRIGPYLVGIVLAYILFKKIKIRSVLLNLLMWIASVGILAICVYLPYEPSKNANLLSSTWSAAERAAFEALSRTAWAVGLAWVVFACNNGRAGVVGDVLNWGGWQPLSRLCFATYMIHPIIYNLDYFNRFQQLYFDRWLYVYYEFSYLVLSMLVGGVLFLGLEAPMAGIEKILLRKRH